MGAHDVTSKDFPVLDCDGHIVEPGTIWSDYVEPQFRDAVRAGLWKEDSESGGFEISLNGRTQFTRKGNASFFGSVIAAKLLDVGNGAIHYDMKLKKKLYTVGSPTLSSFTWSKF